VIPVIFQSLLGSVRADLPALKRGMFRFVMAKGPSHRNSLDWLSVSYRAYQLPQVPAHPISVFIICVNQRPSVLNFLIFVILSKQANLSEN